MKWQPQDSVALAQRAMAWSGFRSELRDDIANMAWDGGYCIDATSLIPTGGSINVREPGLQAYLLRDGELIGE